jgi:hypothetical protein
MPTLWIPTPVPFRVFVGMTCDNPVASYRNYQVKEISNPKVLEK